MVVNTIVRQTEYSGFAYRYSRAEPAALIGLIASIATAARALDRHQT
jgi:hypothetical protein